MENASKALLIAGAILICILLIAIGMYIYNSAQGTIKTAAAQMGQQEKEMYNSMIKKYVGSSKKGSDVKLMIEDVISQNNQYVNESGKFITIYANDIGGFDNTALKAACTAANAYQNSSAENSQVNIDTATAQMRALSKRISSGKNYDIKEYSEDGIIFAVAVTPLNENGVVTQAAPAAKANLN